MKTFLTLAFSLMVFSPFTEARVGIVDPTEDRVGIVDPTEDRVGIVDPTEDRAFYLMVK